MQFLNKLRYKPLYILWAVLFSLTALLGLLFPSAEGAAAALLLIISVIFFLPPWAILAKGRLEGNRKHVTLIRLLALASLAATLVLLCLNVMSVGMSEWMGNVLFSLLTVVCAPLVCSNLYIVPMFLWAALLMASLSRK